MTVLKPSKQTSKKIPPLEHARGVQLLKDFGLTHNEALVYTYLLERGTEIGGSKIAFGTGLHRQYVYIAMEKLLDVGLIETVPSGKQKKYKAVSPSQIEKIAKRKIVEAEDIVKELNTFSAVGNEQNFEVLQGNKAIQQYEMDYAHRAENGDQEYIIGGSSNGFEVVMGDSLDEYIETKDGKRMKVFYIGGSGEETARYKEQKSFEARFLPGLPQKVTHMSIRKDEVVFYSFLNPPLVYVLRSKIVAEDYKSFFMMLWNITEKRPKEI